MSLSYIVLSRLMEVCPAQKVADMSDDELDEAINVAFKIIGYKPFDVSVAKPLALEKDSEWLYQFIYEVWKVDGEEYVKK